MFTIQTNIIPPKTNELQLSENEYYACGMYSHWINMILPLYNNDKVLYTDYDTKMFGVPIAGILSKRSFGGTENWVFRFLNKGLLKNNEDIYSHYFALNTLDDLNKAPLSSLVGIKSYTKDVWYNFYIDNINLSGKKLFLPFFVSRKSNLSYLGFSRSSTHVTPENMSVRWAGNSWNLLVTYLRNDGLASHNMWLDSASQYGVSKLKLIIKELDIETSTIHSVVESNGVGGNIGYISWSSYYSRYNKRVCFVIPDFEYKPRKKYFFELVVTYYFNINWGVVRNHSNFGVVANILGVSLGDFLLMYPDRVLPISSNPGINYSEVMIFIE